MNATVDFLSGTGTVVYCPSEIEKRHLVPRGTCLLAYRGSIAHGMYIPSSDPTSIDDVDLMGVVLGKPEHYFGLNQWGSRGTKEYKEHYWDCVYYEIRKMFSLLLQGNPNVLSMLWLRAEDYLILNRFGKAILDAKSLFVGKHVYNAFAGYAHQQLDKMETRDPAELRDYLAVTAELKKRGQHPNHKGEEIPYPESHDPARGEGLNAAVTSTDALIARLRHYQKKGENLGYLGDKRKHIVLEHGYDSKNAAHCVRLLRMCKEFLMTGEMTVFRPDAAELLDIKRGRWSLEQVKKHANDLFEEIKIARDRSTLPEKPDYERAEAVLIEILHDHLGVVCHV